MKMRSIWLTPLLLFLLGTLCAQEISQSLIFRISAEEYRDLLTGDEPSIAFLENREPTTLAHRYQLATEAAPGHYILLRPQGEGISWELQSKHLHQIYVHDDHKQLNIGIVDTLGHDVSEATMRFEQRKLRYDESAQLYHSRRIKPGLLSIYLPNDTIFYHIETTEKRSVVLRRLQYFSGSRVGRIITWPLRLIRGPVGYLKRGFRWGDWKIYHWPFERLYNRIRHKSRRNTAFAGFIASQQPIYRHGDTLQLTANLSNQKGRPVNDPLQLTIWSKQREWIKTIVTPTAPGRFIFSWHLTDSLPLDTRYYVQLQEPPGSKRYRSIRYNFKLEDYELDEFEFELQNRPATFAADEPVVFNVKAEDSNQLPIPAATVEAYIVAEKFSRLYQNSIAVADTLWSWREEFGNRTTLAIEPPDSIWPPAALAAQIRLYFRGPSGELLTDKHNFTVDRYPPRPELELQNGRILASFAGKLPDQSTLTGTITVYDGSIPLKKELLTYGESIDLNPAATRYLWEVGGQKAQLFPRSDQANVSFHYQWQNDSLQLRWNNPHQLPIHWTLSSSNGILDEGADSLAIYQLSLPTQQSRRQLWISYSYLWAGVAKPTRMDIKALREQLQVDISTPDRIYPGQEASISVAVSDDRGRPQPGTPVVMGAYNAQMRQGSPFTLTDIRFHGRRTPFHRQSYWEEEAFAEGHSPMNNHWFDAFQLDTTPYYELRAPDDSLFLRYLPLTSADSLASVSAQLSPFVIDNFRAQTVQLIYLDNRLLYFADAWQDTPYSIVAEAGYHQLTLRTTEAEIQIDSVFLQAGKRLLLSLDLRQIRHPQVTITKRDATWSQSEIRQVEYRLFNLGPRSVQFSPQYLYEDPKHVYVLQAGKRGIQALGLFSSGRSTTRLLPGRDTMHFRFEPHFYYEIDQKRDRLYQYSPYSSAKKTPEFSRSGKVSSWNEEALFPADIIAPKRQWQYHFDDPPTESAKGRGRLQVFTRNLPAGTKALLLSEADTIRYILPNQLPPIAVPAGRYTLSWATEEGKLWQYELEVVAQQLLAIQIDSTQLQPKPIPKKWQQRLLVSRYVVRGNNRPAGSRRPASRSTQNWVGRGQLISGYIRDESGEPLIGASILIKGTAIGTVADIDGYYELWAPPEEVTIKVNYVGFASKQVTVDFAGEVNINLSDEGMMLDEVVVTGAAVPTVRQDNTLSVNLRGKVAGATLTSEAINRTESTSITLADEPLLPPADSIRTDFRDNAYWQPLLTTDQNGKVSFEVRFPDDITSWRHFALAMDDKARLGYNLANTRAYLPLQAQLYTPRFLVQGDRSEVVGLFNNRTGQTQTVERFFVDWQGTRQEETLEIEDALRQNYLIAEVPEQDSLTFRLGLRQNEYADGEERSLPVFPRGIQRTTGDFFVLHNEAPKQLEVDRNKGAVSLTIGGNALPQLQNAIHRLRTYPHACNEQTASKLIALLANEQLSQYESPPADLQDEIRAAIRRLEKNRHEDGHWGWWPGSEHSSHWITLHVIRAFDLAHEQGYRTPDVTNIIRELLAELPAFEYEKRWRSLLFLAERGQILDYEPYLLQLDTIKRDLETELLYRRMQQLSGTSYTLDSLLNYQQETFTGARYWGQPNRWWWIPYRQTTKFSLQALQLFRDHGDSTTARAIEQYFLEPTFGKPMTNSYHLGLNTYEASLIVKHLIPNYLSDQQKITRLEIFLEQNGQITSQQPLGKVPERWTLDAPEAEQTTVRKTGSGPAFASYAQTYWESNPEIENNGFSIQTTAWQGGQKTSKWELSQEAKLVSECIVSKDADYVKIEIPVPAGCSYGPKVFRETRWETHREYRRDRVVIYCEKLPAGKYSFSVPLETRYAGRYHVNPPQVEMMYIPSFNGVGNSMEVTIE